MALISRCIWASSADMRFSTRIGSKAGLGAGGGARMPDLYWKSTSTQAQCNGSFGQTSSAYSYWKQAGTLTVNSQELNHS